MKRKKMTSVYPVVRRFFILHSSFFIKHLPVFAALCISWLPMQAEVKLPAIFSDGMVMQQQSAANLWGEATPGRRVTVTTGWDKQKYTTTADAAGGWKLTLKTPVAGGPYDLTFNDGETKKLSNILIGELWLASGQSNMEMPMKGFKNQPVEGATMNILRAKNSSLRLFTVKRHAAFTPQTDVTGQWQEASPAAVREFSATAYYFGRLVQEITNVPVGLIVAAWGGSAAEAWMTADMLRAFPDAKIPRSEADITSKNRTPTVLYNGMISPLVGLTIKGVIWYQGEDNYNRAHTYADMFSTLIKGWRTAWGQGDFPFYYCQIAPYDYGIITAADKKVINSAYLREAQSQVENSVPNTGMAVLMDAGMEKCIHPARKRLAGERLALLALTKDYAVSGVAAQSPCYKEMEVQGDTVVVSFDRAGMWISGKGCFSSELFTVAGEDRVFHPAKAWIVRSKMYVKSEAVAHPVAVRYAFSNYADGDLWCEGLPLSSFRSDNW